MRRSRVSVVLAPSMFSTNQLLLYDSRSKSFLAPA